jgi:hypothetical protein
LGGDRKGIEMTNLTPQQIRDAIQQGLEETWRLIDSGKKIQLIPEPQLREKRDDIADQGSHDERSK